MTRYLLDTNHLSDTTRRVSRIRDRVQQRIPYGDRFGTCVPALCELEVGMQQTAQPGEARRRLRGILKRISIWPVDAAVPEVYGALYHELRRRGRVLSQVDLLLGALAFDWNLRLLTSDRDFEALPQIRTENWLP
jgi:predicted nucleic acid-binding protein